MLLSVGPLINRSLAVLRVPLSLQAIIVTATRTTKLVRALRIKDFLAVFEPAAPNAGRVRPVKHFEQPLHQLPGGVSLCGKRLASESSVWRDQPSGRHGYGEAGKEVLRSFCNRNVFSAADADFAALEVEKVKEQAARDVQEGTQPRYR